MAFQHKVARRPPSLWSDGGDPIDRVRTAAEATYETDLSGVRLHSDVSAEDLAAREDARALTQGNDIFFARGELAPGTRDGDLLLAHELAHVAQGNAGGPRRKSERSEPGQPAETEADRAAEKVVANLHDGGVGTLVPREPPSATKMRKKKRANRSTSGKGPQYEGFSGALPGGATRSRMVSDLTFVRLAANVLEINLRESSGFSGVDRPVALAKEVDKLLRKLKAALEAGKSPVEPVNFDANDTKWTLSGSLSVHDMHVVSKEAVTSAHSASSKYEGGASTTRAATDGVHIGGKLGAKGGHAAGDEGGEEDSVEAAIEAAADSSVTDSHGESSGDAGEVGVAYSTKDSAVTYRADIQCDLTLEYVEKDLLFDDDLGSKSIEGMPCGWGTFTFDEPD